MHPTDTTATKIDCTNLFSPKSIAVIGASQNPAKIGSMILRNIISGGYAGKIYPINLTAKTIQGLQAYPSVGTVQDEIGHAVIAIPAKGVVPVVEECGKKGIKEVTIISAGFKESGPEGVQLEALLRKTALQYGVTVLGPNCLGFINTDINLNATFSAATPTPGDAILFSQSGAFGTAILDWAQEVQLGFKYFISLGNKAILDETILLDQWLCEYGDDNDSFVFAGYLEDITNGRKFMQIVSKLSQTHPVVLLKPGKYAESQRAISSHTGALATDDRIIDAALSQAGCLRVRGIQQLFDTIQMLTRQSVPANNRVVIVTNAGGPGVVTTDLVKESLLDMAVLSEPTTFRLSQKLPPESGLKNPIDILGDADAERYRIGLESVLVDENVDAAIVLLTPQAVTEVERTATVISEMYNKYPFKPVVAAFIGGKTTQRGIDQLNYSQMPIFTYPRQAVTSLESAYRYRKIMDHPPFDPENYEKADKPTIESPDKNIVGKQAEEIVTQYGIPVPKGMYVPPGEQPPPDTAEQLTLPVVAKIISAELLHKTDVEAVVTNIKSMEELTSVVAELNERWHRLYPASTKYMIHIQNQIDNGEHVIIGVKRDPSFGPIISFGAGGILTELSKDIALRVAPLERDAAEEMIRETTVFTLLDGYRGKPRRDINSIVDSLLKVSRMALSHPEITEFDINPFIVLNEGSGGYAVDCKIILDTARDAR